MEPLISIVVPSFNQGRYIEQTLCSILGQQYPRLEVIVIDGGSTDETLEVVRRYESRLAHFVSEKDNGQASAINKGFRLAKGDILGWLNSDDLYMPCALAKVAQALHPVPARKLVYGGCLNFFEGERRASAYLPPAYDAKKLRYRLFINQPSSFWTRNLWEAAGELDESLHYVLDWEWFIRASEVGEFATLSEHLALYRFHAAHKTGVGGEQRATEITALVARYAGADWGAVYRDVQPLRAELQKWRGKLNRFNRFLPMLFPRLYRRHGAERVKMALSQFG